MTPTLRLQRRGSLFSYLEVSYLEDFCRSPDFFPLCFIEFTVTLYEEGYFSPGAPDWRSRLPIEKIQCSGRFRLEPLSFDVAHTRSPSSETNSALRTDETAFDSNSFCCRGPISFATLLRSAPVEGIAAQEKGLLKL